jgi:hypothetical protein
VGHTDQRIEDQRATEEGEGGRGQGAAVRDADPAQRQDGPEEAQQHGNVPGGDDGRGGEEDPARHPAHRRQVGAVAQDSRRQQAVERAAGEKGRRVQEQDPGRILHHQVTAGAADQAVHHPAMVVLEPEVAVVGERLQGGERRPPVAAEPAVEHQHMEGRRQQEGGERRAQEATEPCHGRKARIIGVLRRALR